MVRREIDRDAGFLDEGSIQSHVDVIVAVPAVADQGKDVGLARPGRR